MEEFYSEHANIAENVVENLEPWWPLLYAYGIPLIGFCMFASGLYLIAKDAGPRSNGTMFAGIGAMIAGLVMINLKATLTLFTQTLFDTDSPSTMLGYESIDSGDPMAIFVVAAFQIIQLVGLFAFAQGAWLLKKAAANPQISWFKAITHMVGGVIAINHKVFLQVVANTLGGGIGTSINGFLSMAGYS